MAARRCIIGRGTDVLRADPTWLLAVEAVERTSGVHVATEHLGDERRRWPAIWRPHSHLVVFWCNRGRYPQFVKGIPRAVSDNSEARVGSWANT